MTSNRVLNIIAAYGIVQVLAQDLGIKTGKKQRDFITSRGKNVPRNYNDDIN